MKITFEYFGQAREAAGIGREMVDVSDGATATEAVIMWAKTRGGRLETLLVTEDGRLSPSLLIAVGERMIDRDDREPLREGDVVVITPPISGG